MNDTLTDNEIIAEFHGWKHRPTPKGKGRGYWDFPEWGKAHYISDAFRYDTLWDWLMPVVEKMFSLWDGSGTEFQKALNLKLHAFKRKVTIDCPIQQCYNQVLIFIRWYNNQTK